MSIQIALLCDAANVREGLLNILSGGINRVYRPSLPSSIAVTLALLVELDPDGIDLPHEVTVQVNDPDGKVLGRIVAAFQRDPASAPPRLERGESAMLPVAVPLQLVMTDKYGRHAVRVRVDESDPVIRPLWVQHPDELKLPSIT